MFGNSLFTNYVRTGMRSLVKDRAYSAINIAGLSIGIACCLILGLYLYNALNYDAYHDKQDRLYRVVNELTINGKTDFAAITSRELAPLLAEQYPEVEQAMRIGEVPFAQSQLRDSANQAYYWRNLYYASPAILSMLSHDVLYGDPSTALIDPSSIAVSESLARRYFGDRNPIGETLTTDSDSFRIDLVYADQPENTHLKYDALISYNHLPQLEGAQRREALWNINVYTYVLMTQGFDPANFETISKSFFDNNMRAMAEQLNINASVHFVFEPIADVHLYSTTAYDSPRGNIFYVYAFGAIAIFVLAVACINYMNLATARSTRRAKEVGMRKVLGASRGQLVAQFIGESIFYALTSLTLALFFCWLMIQFTPLAMLLDTPLEMSRLVSSSVLPMLIIATILLGIVSGLYPAIYLSSIPPVAAFRGLQGTGRGGRGIRQALVLVQFVISVSVIACTLLMLTQMRYVQGKALGFERDNRLIVRVAGADQAMRLPTFMEELRRLPEVVAVAETNHVPGQSVSLNALNIEDDLGVMQQTSVNTMEVRPGVIDALGMNLLQGRDFDHNRENDPGRTVIVNESMVKAMGWQNPLGKRFQGFDTGEEPPMMEVIGVVEDFHFEGLQHAIVPVAMLYREPDWSEMSAAGRSSYSEQMIINVQGSALPGFIRTLEQRWAQFDPEHSLDVTFLDATLNELYGSESRLMQLVAIFAGLCVLISCLGLFGLSAFNTAQRTKEIGIRKVLGASTGGIILLLFRNILGLVAVAAAIASVLSFWAVGRWLETFYYRIELLGPNLILFAVAALLAIIVAFVTMALQSFKTAQASPILALRHE
jgi:putative ABC transport system permease protein